MVPHTESKNLSWLDRGKCWPLTKKKIVGGLLSAEPKDMIVEFLGIEQFLPVPLRSDVKPIP